jgi:hypothetical protein
MPILLCTIFSSMLESPRFYTPNIWLSLSFWITFCRSSSRFVQARMPSTRLATVRCTVMYFTTHRSTHEPSPTVRSLSQ